MQPLFAKPMALLYENVMVIKNHRAPKKETKKKLQSFLYLILFLKIKATTNKTKNIIKDIKLNFNPKSAAVVNPKTKAAQPIKKYLNFSLPIVAPN